MRGYLLSMDSIVLWNVREMNALNKLRELHMYCNKHRVGLLGMIESKLRDQNMDICKRLFFKQWDFVHNLDYHARGRLWILWKA